MEIAVSNGRVIALVGHYHRFNRGILKKELAFCDVQWVHRRSRSRRPACKEALEIPHIFMAKNLAALKCAHSSHAPFQGKWTRMSAFYPEPLCNLMSHRASGPVYSCRWWADRCLQGDQCKARYQYPLWGCMCGNTAQKRNKKEEKKKKQKKKELKTQSKKPRAKRMVKKRRPHSGRNKSVGIPTSPSLAKKRRPLSGRKKSVGLPTSPGRI